MVAAKHSTNTLRVSFIVFLPVLFLVALPYGAASAVLSRGEIVRDDPQMRGGCLRQKKLMQCVAE